MRQSALFYLFKDFTYYFTYLFITLHYLKGNPLIILCVFMRGVLVPDSVSPTYLTHLSWRNVRPHATPTAVRQYQYYVHWAFLKYRTHARYFNISLTIETLHRVVIIIQFGVTVYETWPLQFRNHWEVELPGDVC